MKKILVGVAVACMVGLVARQVIKNKNNGEVIINEEVK